MFTSPDTCQAILPYPWNSPTVVRITRALAEDDLVTARCPVCRHPLIARMLDSGPGFRCACPANRRTSGLACPVG